MIKRYTLMAVCAALCLTAQLLNASPYASCITITNNGAGVTNVQFYLNESGGTVTVTYEDGSTNANFNGITTGLNVTKGQSSFSLSGHTGYNISVNKIGNGVPFQTSVDTAANANTSANYTYWNSGRGVSINQNPKIGSLFGRVYVDNSAASTSGNPTKGLYCLNPDLSFAGISNTVVGTGSGIFAISGSTSAPYHIRVAPDGTLYVGDFSTATAALWQFAPDLQSSNLVLGPVGENQGVAANAHGDMFGTSHISGSLATSNLVVWVADGGMPIPSVTADPTIVLGPGTSRGMYNNVYEYNIGAGPLPWTNGPNYAFNLGLDVIGELTDESDVAPDGKIFAAFGRSNLSNPCLSVLDPTGATVLWTSWIDTGGNSDPWRGDILSSTVQYPYGGVRVSSDDSYVATMGIDNAFIIADLTNGIPDDNSLFVITNLSATGNARGMDWDIADNIYGISSGQAELRAYSLARTTTCITSNDITGTNGTFVVITPSLNSTATATTPTASQNYGTPTAGVVNIALTTNALTSAVTVGFTLTGSAAYPVNYTINTGTNSDGVIITATNVTFPAGTWPYSGNWSVNVNITPTASPLSGPTLVATLTLLGGANYSAGGSSAIANVTIINTGPQLLKLSLVSGGTTFSRAITNDYVKFVVTRFGDLTVAPYTVTNINYNGTAVFNNDYTAQAQAFTGSILTDGSPGFVMNPGVVTMTNAIGNPVMRANLNVPATNVTIVLSFTNSATGTNVTSSEGFPYTVSATNVITLTELDNTYGDRVILWSNPLTNANDSVNWTLAYANQNLGTNTTLPALVPNYTNNESSYLNGGTNDFDVEFGYGLPSGTPSSPAMLANGWTNVLKMTVNKSQGSPAAVNLYPQGQKFYGNYALKFSMYLSIWPTASGNIYAGATPREYALFGINHNGTNCNWRPSVGSLGITNADGEWFAIDEADNAATPADYDAFTSPGNMPNPGIAADFTSNPGSAMRNIFKNPPFTQTENPLGGEPVDQWSDVSVAITQQTNCTVYVDGAQVLASFALGSTNSTTRNTFPATSLKAGSVMLGYLDPDASIGDPGSQFVYYSNIRVVELSPYITNQPVSLIVTNGANVSFTSGATYGTAPITNNWYQVNSGLTPVASLMTNNAAATNITTTLSLSNVQVGTNYLATFSDLAGSVTGLVAQLEVIFGPTNATANAGTTFTFRITASGRAAPTSYQWKTNGVAVGVGGTVGHFGPSTNSTFIITNVLASDAMTYSVAVVNSAGTVTPSATLTVSTPPSAAAVTPASQTSLWGATAQFTVTNLGSSPLTYQWKQGGVDLSNGGAVSGATSNILTITGVTGASAGSYTVGVTNTAGGTVSSAGTLIVSVPAPTFTGLTSSGGNINMTFTSPNGNDTTNAFILLSCGVVSGPYTNAVGAVFNYSAGTFTVIAPQNGSTMFYRLQHAN